jgi:hypothetical protein
MGPLTEGEACEYYRLLLNLLDKMDNLTPEVKETLRKEVQVKIDSTEKVEEAKMEDRRAVKAEEFAKAKAGFNRLSSFVRL